MRTTVNWRGLSGLLLFWLLASAYAEENNFWPAFVWKHGSEHGRYDQLASLGPFVSLTDREGVDILSFRPLWTSFEAHSGNFHSSHVLYPMVSWGEEGYMQNFKVLSLIQYRHDTHWDSTFFQFLPFLYYQDSPIKEENYFAIWPLGGVLKDRYWRDEIRFVLWPLYVRTVRDDEIRTHFPYPFLHVLQGPKSRGFGIWPLYGQSERDGDYEHTWALWPLYYDFKDHLEDPFPYERFGILPLYSREEAEGMKSETWIWPFFGYTRESEPRVQYTENRYFWPFLVQGRGEERYINRWLPLFSNERRPGYEKHWFVWPALKLEEFDYPGMVRERTSLFYFIYRDEVQHFAGTKARLTFIWPFLSYWNDGYGQRQFQALDPLTVFFPRNEKVRENWTPLFALYRYDERNGSRRHSLLWDLLVWRKDSEGLEAIYLGPIFEWERGHHWGILKGLIGTRSREGERQIQFFWRK